MAAFIDVVEGTNTYSVLLGIAIALIAVGHSMRGMYGGTFIKVIGLLMLFVAGAGVGAKLLAFITAEPRMFFDAKHTNIIPNIVSGCAVCVAAAVLFFYAAYTIVV